MAKRSASSELNDKNWDNEDEPEEAGEFAQASNDIMKNRTIKKAKRRLGDENEKSGAFSGFTGLAAIKATNSLNQDALASSKKPVGDSVSSTPFNIAGPSSVNGSDDQRLKGFGDTKETSPYLNRLKSLNESVLSWITQHFEKNPYIILSPVFRDYENYIEQLKSEKSSAPNLSVPREDVVDNSEIEATKVASSASMEASESSGSSASSAVQCSTSSTTCSGIFMAPGSVNTTSGSGFFNMNSQPTSSFGNLFSSTSTSSNFALGTFSFAKSNVPKPQPSAENAEDKDNEEYEPPKPEVKQIVEENALYSIRCKLYYQKDGQWVDKGVGNLHLKPVEETKTQLVIRADTNLGNILLNIMLTSSMPVSRQGKNNVSLICVANPPFNPADKDGTPTPMLIRVKTEELADELFEKMNERKKLI